MRHGRDDHEGALLASAEAFAIAQRVGNVGSYDWLSCLNVHARALEILDRRPDLLTLLRDARTALIDTLGTDHRTVRETDARLAALRRRWGAAEPLANRWIRRPPRRHHPSCRDD